MPAEAPQPPQITLDESQVPGISSAPRSNGGWVAFGVIAVLLAGVTCGWLVMASQPREQAAWGFARGDLLDQSVSAEQYWLNLATGFDDWETLQSANRTELREQFVEFRSHYQKLLTLPHQPLEASDRAWLTEKLIEWNQAFEQRSNDIDTLVLPIDHVRRQTAMTMRKIANQLRYRGKQDSETSESNPALEAVSEA